MATATLTSNGMIHLPREIQKKLSIKPGDKIGFIDTGDEIVLIPQKNLFELINNDEKNIAREIVRELKTEHMNEG